MEQKIKKVGNYEVVIRKDVSKSYIEINLDHKPIYCNEINGNIDFDVLELVAVDEIYKLEEKNNTIDNWLSVFSV